MSKESWRQITKTDLARLYETHTTYEIGDIFGVGAERVRKKLIKYAIPRRARGVARSFDPSRSELEALYQSLSMKQIAERFGVGETTVWTRLKEFGIKLNGHEDGGHRKKPGRKFTREHRVNLSKSHRGKWSGERNPHWKGGIHAIHLRMRQSGEYKQWRLSALALRGNCCEECGVENGSACDCCGTRVKLHVHHVVGFAKVPERRFDPENSEVLCPKCHHSRHHGKIG